MHRCVLFNSVELEAGLDGGCGMYARRFLRVGGATPLVPLSFPCVLASLPLCFPTVLIFYHLQSAHGAAF